MAAEVTAGKDSFMFASIKPLSDRRVLQILSSSIYDVFPDGQRFFMAVIKPDGNHAPLTLVTNWRADLKK